MEVGVVYNAILPEGRTKVDGIDCDALESDDRLAALLVLVEILKFAIEVDEWLLAVIVLEHFNKTELREFVVHMFQPEFHKSSAIFFRFPDNTAAPQGGFCDLSVRMFERFWRVFHGLLPLVVDKLSNTRSTLEDIYQRFLQEEDIVSACLIWTSSTKKLARGGVPWNISQRISSEDMHPPRQIISPEASFSILEWLKFIADRQVNIYEDGRNNNFYLASQDFRQRYNATKEKYGGDAGEEMMELYGDHSLYKIATAMIYLLEQSEYIMFARYFHVFSPPYLVSLCKQIIGCRPHVFEVFKELHEANDLTIVQIFCGLVLQFFVCCRQGEGKSIRSFTSDKLLFIEKSCAADDLSSLFEDPECFDYFASHFRREKLYMSFFRLDVFHAIKRDWIMDQSCRNATNLKCVSTTLLDSVISILNFVFCLHVIRYYFFVIR